MTLTAKPFLFLLPTASTGLVRILQLGIMLVLANVASGAERSLLVAGFGLLSSFAMITDSGAGNFLLSIPLRRIGKLVYAKAVAFHFTLAAIGGLVAVVFIGYPVAGSFPSNSLLILVALAVTQAVDSTGRITRAPTMVAKRDALYALPDILLFSLKLPILVAAILTANLDMLLFLPLPSLLVATVTFRRTHRALPETDRDALGVYRRILEFGATGALSAFYSQSPLLIAAVYLPISDTAALAIVYRVVQALDVVPGTLSLQLVPRVRDRQTRPWAYWAMFFFGGAVVALFVIALKPVIEHYFQQPPVGILLFSFVALSYAPKSGNYALSAYLMGTNRIRVRLQITLCACFGALALSLVVVPRFGATGLAAATLLVEMLFTTGVAIALHQASRRLKSPPTKSGDRTWRKRLANARER